MAWVGAGAAPGRATEGTGVWSVEASRPELPNLRHAAFTAFPILLFLLPDQRLCIVNNSDTSANEDDSFQDHIR